MRFFGRGFPDRFDFGFALAFALPAVGRPSDEERAALPAVGRPAPALLDPGLLDPALAVLLFEAPALAVLLFEAPGLPDPAGLASLFEAPALRGPALPVERPVRPAAERVPEPVPSAAPFRRGEPDDGFRRPSDDGRDRVPSVAEPVPEPLPAREVAPPFFLVPGFAAGR